MARDIAAAALAAAQGDHVRFVALVHLDYTNADVYVCSAPFNIAWEPDGASPNAVFLGVGNFGRVSVVQESAEQRAEKITLELSGVPSANISQSLIPSEYANRRVRVWLALVDDQHAIIGTPMLLWRGRIDTQDAEIGGPNSRIVVTCVDRRADWDRPRIRRYSDAEQQARFPGDLGLQYAVQIAEKEIAWPEKLSS